MFEYQRICKFSLITICPWFSYGCPMILPFPYGFSNGYMGWGTRINLQQIHQTMAILGAWKITRSPRLWWCSARRLPARSGRRSVCPWTNGRTWRFFGELLMVEPWISHELSSMMGMFQTQMLHVWNVWNVWNNYLPTFPPFSWPQMKIHIPYMEHKGSINYKPIMFWGSPIDGNPPVGLIITYLWKVGWSPR